MDIYLWINGVKYGPFTESAIDTWIKEGRINGDTLCWFQGLSEWVPLKTAFPQKFQPRMPNPAPSPESKVKKKKGGCLKKIAVVVFVALLFFWLKGKYEFYKEIKPPAFPESKSLELVKGNWEKNRIKEIKVKEGKYSFNPFPNCRVNFPFDFENEEVSVAEVSGLYTENGSLLAPPIEITSDKDSDFSAPVKIEFSNLKGDFYNRDILCVAISPDGEKSYPFSFLNRDRTKFTVLTDHFTVFTPIAVKKTKMKYSPTMTVPKYRAYGNHRLSQNSVASILTSIRPGSSSLPPSALSDVWSIFNEQFGIDTTLTSFAENALYAEGFSKFNSYVPEVGLGLAFVQLGIDLYNGDNKMAAINLTKSLGYYSIGKTFPTRAMNVAMAGVFVIDYSLNKFGTEAWAGRTNIYTEIGKRWLEERRKKGERGKWWFKKLDKVIQSSIDTPDKIPEKIEKCFDDYANQLWGNDEEIAIWQSRVMKYTNFTGGGGLSEEMRKNMANQLKNQLKQYNQAVMRKLADKYLKKQKQAATKSMLNVINFLNKKHRITIEVVDQNGKPLNEAAGFEAGLKVKDRNKGKFWKTKINKAGKGYLFCTNLGFINAGFPRKVYLIVGYQDKKPLIVEKSFKLKKSYETKVRFVIKTDDIEGQWRGEYKIYSVPFKDSIVKFIAKLITMAGVGKSEKEAYEIAKAGVSEVEGLRDAKGIKISFKKIAPALYLAEYRVKGIEGSFTGKTKVFARKGKIKFTLKMGNFNGYFKGRILGENIISGECDFGTTEYYPMMKAKWSLKKID